MRVERPWGSYEVLGTGEGYQVKEIRVKPGMRLSYQRHARRSEYWLVISGVAEVVIEGEKRIARAGESVYVPLSFAHRVGAGEGEELVFVEIQRGTYLGEDDIERLEDDFGRADKGSAS